MPSSSTHTHAHTPFMVAHCFSFNVRLQLVCSTNSMYHLIQLILLVSYSHIVKKTFHLTVEKVYTVSCILNIVSFQAVCFFPSRFFCYSLQFSFDTETRKKKQQPAVEWVSQIASSAQSLSQSSVSSLQSGCTVHYACVWVFQWNI